jgi:hypothetical protein
MTMSDEYRDKRQYGPDDTVAIHKCAWCDDFVPEDEAAEYQCEYYHKDCAHAADLLCCSWCGKWMYFLSAITVDEKDYHFECLKEMALKEKKL